MKADKTQVQYPNRLILPILIAVGLSIGVLPFLLYKSAVYLIGPYFAWSLASAWWVNRKFEGTASAHPSLTEWLLAGWSAVGPGASASIIGFIWHAFGYALIWAAVFVANSVGWMIDPDPSTGATYVSWFFAGILGLSGPFFVSSELPHALYPGIAGVRSSFFGYTSMRWMLALVALAGMAGLYVALVVLELDPNGLWFTLALTMYLAVTAGPLQESWGRAQTPAARQTTVRAIRRLFSEAGYKTIDRPRTDDPELAALVASIDLLAISDQRAYAVQISDSTSEESTGAAESKVFEVRAGAQALQRATEESDSGQLRVVPYLLIVGGQVNDGLRELCQELLVSIAHVPDNEVLRRTAVATDSGELRDTALRVLQVPLADDPMPLKNNELQEQTQQ